MENLKQNLFTACSSMMKQYLQDSAIFGENDIITRSTYSAFCALYGLIETSDLENEYQEWKKQSN